VLLGINDELMKNECFRGKRLSTFVGKASSRADYGYKDGCFY
jgi:hypothetical protein